MSEVWSAFFASFLSALVGGALGGLAVTAAWLKFGYHRPGPQCVQHFIGLRDEFDNTDQSASIRDAEWEDDREA